MENTENEQIKKGEHLWQEVRELEKQICLVKNQINALNDEESLQNSEKNSLEARKNRLKHSIDLYEIHVKKTNVKLTEKQATYLKLSMINEYYNKLLEKCKETYFPQENCDLFQDNSSSEVNKEKISNLDKHIQDMKSTIETNSSTIDNLLIDLQYN